MDMSANHPSLLLKERIDKICRPLFGHTPFKKFSYVRFYYDGYYFPLTQTPDFDYHLHTKNFIPNLEELHNTQTHALYLSPCISFPDSLNGEKFRQHIHLAKDFEIYHQFILIYKLAHYTEIFVFGLNELQQNVIDISLNYLPFIKKFVVYFRESSHQLVSEMNQNKILFEPTTNPTIFVDINIGYQEAYQLFLKDLKLNKYPLNGKLGDCILTPREFECLMWLCKNRSVKQVSQILRLSPRTIETHVNNLKKKLGCNSKLEFLEIYAGNPIMDIFSDFIGEFIADK